MLQDVIPPELFDSQPVILEEEESPPCWQWKVSMHWRDYSREASASIEHSFVHGQKMCFFIEGGKANEIDLVKMRHNRREIRRKPEPKPVVEAEDWDEALQPLLDPDLYIERDPRLKSKSKLKSRTPSRQPAGLSVTFGNLPRASAWKIAEKDQDEEDATAEETDLSHDVLLQLVHPAMLTMRDPGFDFSGEVELISGYERLWNNSIDTVGDSITFLLHDYTSHFLKSSMLVPLKTCASHTVAAAMLAMYMSHGCFSKDPSKLLPKASKSKVVTQHPQDLIEHLRPASPPEMRRRPATTAALVEVEGNAAAAGDAEQTLPELTRRPRVRTGRKAMLDTTVNKAAATATAEDYSSSMLRISKALRQAQLGEIHGNRVPEVSSRPQTQDEPRSRRGSAVDKARAAVLEHRRQSSLVGGQQERRISTAGQPERRGSTASIARTLLTQSASQGQSKSCSSSPAASPGKSKSCSSIIPDALASREGSGALTSPAPNNSGLLPLPNSTSIRGASSFWEKLEERVDEASKRKIQRWWPERVDFWVGQDSPEARALAVEVSRIWKSLRASYKDARVRADPLTSLRSDATQLDRLLLMGETLRHVARIVSVANAATLVKVFRCRPGHLPGHMPPSTVFLGQNINGLDTVVRLARKEIKAALVIFCSSYKVGGTFLSGNWQTAEAEACIRSSFYALLHEGAVQTWSMKGPGIGKGMSLPDDGVIRCSGVAVFRAPGPDFEPFQEVVEVEAIIAVGLHNFNPQQTAIYGRVAETMSMTGWLDSMKRKWNAAFDAALDAGVGRLVVVDRGCLECLNSPQALGFSLGRAAATQASHLPEIYTTGSHEFYEGMVSGLLPDSPPPSQAQLSVGLARTLKKSELSRQQR